MLKLFKKKNNNVFSETIREDIKAIEKTSAQYESARTEIERLNKILQEVARHE